MCLAGIHGENQQTGKYYLQHFRRFSEKKQTKKNKSIMCHAEVDKIIFLNRINIISSETSPSKKIRLEAVIKNMYSCGMLS